MRSLLLTISLLLVATISNAQFFGKNKPRYRSFDFKVKETPHFDLHYYTTNEVLVNRFAMMAEQWYNNHQQIVGDSFNFKNPLIVYNNHAEFQQTNSISGDIGVGTGGVTEAFKNRVVMPLTFSNQTTKQVLGHELVHAFQFYSILSGDSTNLQSLANLPLWMVEGMAEYLSLGRVDPFTSMWMRDAVVNDDVPALDKMDRPKYFPYRYGQAFWSFVTGTYGDQVIKPLFVATAQYGFDIACLDVLNTSSENLSSMWQSAIKTHYQPLMENKEAKPRGKVLISDENGGRINVSPSLSPNGRYVIFLSEKDVFSTDLYLADARTGKIIRKISSLVKDGDLDNFNYLESAGTWSPDGNKFAFVGIKKGRNVLVIKNADNGNTIETIVVPGVDGLASPTWSPSDKNVIAFTGLVEGQADLYSYHLKTKKVTQLTNDIYSEILPNFNEEGDKIVFSYDKSSVLNPNEFGAITYDIAVMDLTTKNIEVLNLFHGVENLNPSFDHEGNIYFISERDGFRNLYKYFSNSREIYQMTDLKTGISGITRYSPMISVATKRDKIMYTSYQKNGYNIIEASSTQFLSQRVDPQDINLTAGTLPVTALNKTPIVTNNLRSFEQNISKSNISISDKKYSPRFKLDYIGGGTGVGVGNTSLNNNVGLQGGIDMIFSDMLGNHQLFGQAALNGEILDIGGQFSYLNRTNQLAWGIGLSHIPQRTGFQEYALTDVALNDGTVVYDALEQSLNLIRIFDEGVNVFAHFPFSTTLRLEGGIGASYRSFRYDIYKDYYQQFGNQLFYLGQQRERVSVGDRIPFNEYFTLVKGFGGSANIALVGDNSFFGLTSPLSGHRYRFSIDKSIGADDFFSLTADYRKYIWMKPISLAFRATAISRFEKNVNSVFPYYVGQMGFVRGYGSIFSYEILDELGIDFGQVLGSKLAVGSIEIRLPFTGPKQLSLIGTNAFFSDLVLFLDAGMAFDEFSQIKDGELLNAVLKDGNGNIITDTQGNPIYAVQALTPTFARSAGLSMRINLFGAMIIEPYYARQLISNGQWTFGLNFVPGW